MTRQMVMVGFLQAQNCTNLPSSWRHPESRDDSMSADYYQEIGRILESGRFHMAFFDDRLAMPDRYGNDHAHTVEYGIRCVKMDPLVVLTCMGMATEKLGLGATASTTGISNACSAPVPWAWASTMIWWRSSTAATPV